MRGKAMKYEMDNLNNVLSASLALFLNESYPITAISIGAMNIKNTLPTDANPDHFQKTVVKSNNSSPPKQANTISNFKMKISFRSFGFSVLVAKKNNAIPNIGTSK